MPQLLQEFINKTKLSWTGLQPKVKRRVVLFFILLLVCLSLISFLLGRVEYTILYSDLEAGEAQEVLTVLQDLGVKTKVQGNGSVLVDAKQEEQVRIQLAMQGYPKTGLNYDLYMNSISFTTSSQDKKIMLVYQLQERLGSTISMLNGIENAVVNITTEEESVFRFDDDAAGISACVVLDLQNNFQPSVDQIRAVQRLLITSISGLKQENVAVIDQDLQDLLPLAADGYGQSASGVLDFEQEIEKGIEAKVLYLFEPVFGVNNIKVGVNAIVNMDRVSSEVIEYTPVIDDQGIPYLIEELNDKLSDSSSNSSDSVSTYSVESDSMNNRFQKVVNYRVNELRQTIDEAQGGIEDLSLSVLINGEAVDQSVLNDVKAIVATAVGIAPAKISVNQMNFTAFEEQVQQVQQDLAVATGGFPISEETIIIVVALLVVMVLGILILRQFSKASKAVVQEIYTAQDSVYDEPKRLSDDEMQLELRRDGILDNMDNMEKDQKVLEEIGNIIEASPASVAQVLRVWLKEGN
jgi:flagellar M-ring protein FliF